LYKFCGCGAFSTPLSVFGEDISLYLPISKNDEIGTKGWLSRAVTVVGHSEEI